MMHMSAPQQRRRVCEADELRIFVGTWNLAGEPATASQTGPMTVDQYSTQTGAQFGQIEVVNDD